MSIARLPKMLAGGSERSYFAFGVKTALKVLFWNNEPRPTKFARCLRWGRLDPVWRRNSDRAVFATLPFAAGLLATHPLCPAQEPLQHQRILGSLPLPADLGSRTDRDHRAAAPQRGLSLFDRLAGLSGSHQFAALSGTVRACRSERFPQVARPLACGDARPPGASPFRFGQHRADRLRPPGTSRRGLQPEEARTPLLSSAAVLRRADAGLLGGELPCGQCARFDGHAGAAGARFCQVAGSDPTSPRARRRSLLRSQNHRVYRAKPRLLRDRCPTDPAPEESASGTALPSCRVGSVGSGVSLLPAGMARAATLHRHSPTGARRTFGAIAPVSDARLQLPSLGHQPFVDSTESLALLQSARSRRVDHPRTERRLCVGEDSHPRLRGQRGIFPDRFAGLQPSELVQAALCSTASATRQPATPTSAAVRGPVSVGAARGRAYAPHRAELRLRGRFPRNSAAHPPSEIPIPNLLSPLLGAATQGFLGINCRSFFTPDSG